MLMTKEVSLAIGLRTLFTVLGALSTATVLYTLLTDGLPFCMDLLTPYLAGGNSALALAMTVISNMLGILIALVGATSSDSSLKEESGVRMVALFDHEECGSDSAKGAGSLRNTELRAIEADPAEAFDVGAILSIARRQLSSEWEGTRIEALHWISTLLNRHRTEMLPAVGYSDNPSTSFASKFVHTSLNKNRCPINRVLVS
ncbi:hypothetical protein RIF29_34079 [Crotalaria pallida]|uniref:Uncharacterized protein n=1 Tax=Crotalaria pallida TaxID=3830 RepID=A0AAN9E922_CROPI